MSHSWRLLSVVGYEFTPQVDSYMSIGMKRFFEASITNFLCGSVGSLHIFIPIFWHWSRFISEFPILFPNYKSFPKYSNNTSLEYSVNIVTPVNIIMLICYLCSGSNGDILHSSEVNETDIYMLQNNGYNHDCPFQLLMPFK